MTILCGYCKKPFEVKNMSGCPEFCSDACNSRSYRRRKNPERYGKRPCAVCGDIFEATEGIQHVCCSSRCQGIRNKQRKADWYKANKARLDAYRGEWAKANREKQAAYVRTSRTRKPDHYRAMSRAEQNKRRARQMKAEGSHTEQQWRDLVESTGNKCLRCQIPGTHASLTKDHVMPISIGGTDNIDNLQPLCMSCNSWKHVKHIDYREASHATAA